MALSTGGCASLGQPPAADLHAAPRGLDAQHDLRPFPAGVDARQYALLRPAFVPQQTDASCSAAAVAMVVNALRRQRGLAPLDENQVAAADRSRRWAERIRPGGPGVDLDGLRLLALEAVSTLQGPAAPASVVDVLHAPPAEAGRAAGQDALRAVHYVLSRSAAQPGEAFVLANARQRDLFRGGEDVGHFVVVGAFDEARSKVLLFDVDDREGLPPFWLGTRQLLKAMRGRDDVTGETRGLLWLHR